MSKRRLVITAVLAGQSQTQVAATYGVSQGWISKLMARYRLEGQAAFEPLSRAPAASPSATPEVTVELILQLRKQLAEAGLDAGADTIGWHLTHTHGTTVSRATINRILTRAGAVAPEPSKGPLGCLRDRPRQFGAVRERLIDRFLTKPLQRVWRTLWCRCPPVGSLHPDAVS